MLVMLGIFIASFSTVARADSPESIMNDLPSLPDNACTLQKRDKEDFLAKVSKLQARVDVELRRHKKNTKMAVKNNEENVRATMTQGMQAMDREAMKKMSKEERKAMAKKYAEEMMNNPDLVAAQHHIIDEEATKKMSEEERKAMAKKDAAEMMNNPDLIAAQHNIIADVGKAQREQTSDVQKMTVRFEKFKQQLSDVENDPQAKALLTNEIMPLRTIVANKMGVASNNGLEQDMTKLISLEKRYCTSLMPRWLAIMNDYKDTLKTSLDEFNRIDQKQAVLSKTMGAQEAFVEPGISALQEIDFFLNQLANSFQYAIKTDL